MANLSIVYEINTRVWLRELSLKYRRDIKLGQVPEEEFNDLRKSGFDAIWLMGVWLSSKRGREIVLEHQQLRDEFLRVLPDLKPEDIACSPYAIAAYEIDPLLGGGKGAAAFRKRAHKHGMKLFLDFVPNHLALDHPWIKTHPEYFINGTAQEMSDNPDMFFRAGDEAILAHGKDPYFPAWTDVAQLNYFNPETAKAMRRELLKVVSWCDGVRCDMAMLILKEIQKKIWGEKVFRGDEFKEPGSEFWQEAILKVKKSYPEFIFIAEAYWGLEAELISLGFDYAYDKSFYDQLKETRIRDVKTGLSESSEWTDNKLRFIENHDEPRAATVFGDEKSKAAALIMVLASGAHLFHQGQMEGFKIRLPIQLLRRPPEEVNPGIRSFYETLLSHLKTLIHSESRWILLDSTCDNFVALFNGRGYLAVINYSDAPSQGYAHLDLPDIRSKNLLFKDLLGPAQYSRASEEIASAGLYLDLMPYGFHLFKITGEDDQNA